MPGEALPHIPPQRETLDHKLVRDHLNILTAKAKAFADSKEVKPPLHDINDIIDQCAADSLDWFPKTSDDLPFNVLACLGELGEVGNVVKKVMRGSSTYAMVADDLCEEVTDVFIYLMNMMAILKRHCDFDIVEAYAKKRQFNHERFGIDD